MRPHQLVALSLRMVAQSLRTLAGSAPTERASALLATAAVGSSFAPGLLPRGGWDQAVVTGVVASAEYGVVVTTQSLLGGLIRTGLRRTPDRLAATLVADALLAGAGLGLQRALPEHRAEPVRRASLRAAGRTAAQVGLAGAAVTVTELAQERILRTGSRTVRDTLVPSGVLLGAIIAAARIRAHRSAGSARYPAAVDPLPQAVASLAAGLGLAAGMQGIATLESVLARSLGRGVVAVVPAGRPLTAALGHAAITAALGAAAITAVNVVHQRAEAGGATIELAHLEAPASTSVSGGANSRIHWASLSREGMRFVSLALSPDDIAAVTGTLPPQGPVRVFVPLAAALTVDERVTAAIEELERLGGFERSVICLASPTGTGYLNHVAVESLEFLTRGDCATLALQYSLRPSYLSLDRVAVGREQNRALLHALSLRLRAVPPERRPRLVAFGESLGAHTLQDAVLHEGAAGLRRSDIDAALFVGTPAGSAWARQWRADAAHADPDGEVVEIASFEEWAQLKASTRARARYVLLSRHDDPIVRLDAALAVQRPDWLGAPGQRLPGVPPGMKWYPLTTFLLTVVDTKNALDVVPGVFVSRGHDYRADLARMVAVTLRLPASPEDLGAVERALRERERTWARHRLVVEQLHRAREAVNRQLSIWGPIVADEGADECHVPL